MNITIESILDGWQVSEYFGGAGQFLDSVAIDPDMPKDDSSVKPSGMLRPTSMAKFSGTEITGVPLWFVTNPKTNSTYLYANDGKVHTITNGLIMGTALNSGNALTTASGNGAAYYDNAIYFATNVNITKYSPLNGSASLNQTYWGTTLSLTALTNTTYPTINGVLMPNHVMCYHEASNKLFFADVKTSNEGIISFIKTTKTSVEGDTNDGSTYAALTLGYGEYVTCIEDYGDLIAFGFVEGTDTDIRQVPAQISFWDTTSTALDKIICVSLHDPLVTALKNVNGQLYVFSGYAKGGCRVSIFAGGYTLQEIAWLPDVYPPISQGAVDHILNRVVFGTNTVTPEASASVFSVGAKERNFPLGIHNILRASGTGANPWVTAVKYLSTSSGKITQPVIGFDDDTSKGLDKISTTYGDYNVWRSGMFRISDRFKINKIGLRLADAVAANMTLVVKAYYNDGDSNATLATINNADYTGERNVDIYPQELMENNFYLQLEWTGSALMTVSLPITIQVETLDD
ncbi:hypothetical protein M0R04_12885 [Candidatus Dojkabacteria bacterium]|nr:hypothetical protein [Candidatus Dojkabacteria bacterium]